VLIHADPLGLPPTTWLAPVLVVAVGAILVMRVPALQWIIATVGACALIGTLVVALRAHPPGIDVFQTLQGASNALLHGQNPHQPTFPVEAAVTPFTYVIVPAHFDYLPVAALITAPGRMLGDVRWVSVVAFAALIAFGLRLAWQSPGRVDPLRADRRALLGDPDDRGNRVLLVGRHLFDARMRRLDRAPRQTSTLVDRLSGGHADCQAGDPDCAGPGAALVRRARFDALVALVIAMVLILPFAVATGIGNFYQDIIEIQASQNFRGDGLTLNSAFYALSGQILPVWFGLLAGAGVALFALRRRPADLADVLCNRCAVADGGVSAGQVGISLVSSRGGYSPSEVALIAAVPTRLSHSPLLADCAAQSKGHGRTEGMPPAATPRTAGFDRPRRRARSDRARTTRAQTHTAAPDAGR
jgi:hypothetical protein